MKKITILALHLGTGGIENAISCLANILIEKYEVEIIATYKINEKPAFYLNPKIKIKYLMEDLKPNEQEFKNALKHFNIKNIFKEGFKALKILYLKKKLMIDEIKKLDSDIVISTRDIHNEWLGKYGKNTCIKIAQEHNHHNDNQKYINKIIKSVKNVDYFMPTSNQLAEFYKEKLKGMKPQVKFIRNSLERYTEKISDLEGKNIISVGRISPEKGYLDLIDVFKIVNKKYPDWKLNIVGDGVQFQELKEKVEKENLKDNVILHGFQNKDKIEEIMLNSSIYVMTSFTESFGLVLIEAESYGLPLVVFDTAQGAHEIIENGKNGFFIENRDKEKMASKIIELIEDKQKRSIIGQAGRKMAKKYKKEEVARLWYEFIDNCTKIKDKEEEI